jgi:hypothetical protein
MVVGVGEVCYIMLEVKGGGVPVGVAGHNDIEVMFQNRRPSKLRS